MMNDKVIMDAAEYLGRTCPVVESEKEYYAELKKEFVAKYNHIMTLFENAIRNSMKLIYAALSEEDRKIADKLDITISCVSSCELMEAIYAEPKIPDSMRRGFTTYYPYNVPMFTKPTEKSEG